MSVQRAFLRIGTAFLGFLLTAVFSIILPVNYAEYAEFEHYDRSLEEYKAANKTRYVDLKDPLFIAIRKESGRIFSDKLSSEIHFAVLAVTATCTILAVIAPFFDRTFIAITLAPTIFALLSGCMNPLLWLLLASLPFSALEVKRRIVHVARENR